MTKYKFKHYHAWETYLTRFNVYAVQSIADDQTIYLLDGDEFAILRNREGMRWKIAETPEVAKKITVDAVKDEILAIYEDIKDLKRMRINYGEVKR